MSDATVRYPRVWSDRDSTVTPNGRIAETNFVPGEVMLEQAAELFLRESLRSTLGRRHRELRPFSREWFEGIDFERYERQASWLPRLLEFEKHRGETVVGYGDGLGADWIQYARAGANVVACCRNDEQLHLVRENFNRAGHTARFLVCPESSFPIADSNVDVVCTNFAHGSNVGEITRILRPGGKVLALFPARYDLGFWLTYFAPWAKLFLRSLNPLPDRPRLSLREARRLFHTLVDHRVRKRLLRRSDLPHLIRWLPPEVLERTFGKIVVLKAFKPVQVIAAHRHAA